MRRFLLVLASFAFLAFGSPSTPFTIDQIMRAPFASEPLAAPKGSRVAWLLNDQGQRNIWIASGPDWIGKKVTSFNEDDGQEIAELSWAPDGNYLVFARGGDFEFTGRDNPDPALSPLKPTQDIWIVAMDGSEPKKLTEGRAPAVSPRGDLIAFLRAGQIFTMKSNGEDAKAAVNSFGSARNLVWSPDGSLLAFVSARQNHSFIGVYDPAAKSLRYLDPSVDSDIAPEWSPDSAHIAYLRIAASTRAFDFGPERSGEPWSIRETNLHTHDSREVFRASPGPGSVFHGIDSGHQIFWTPSDTIVFPWEKTGWCHLYALSLKTPEKGKKSLELTPGEGEVEHVAISEDRKTIYYSSNIGDIDGRRLWSLDTSGSQGPKPLTKGDGIQWSPAPVADGSALIFLASSYNQKAHAEVRTADGRTNTLAHETTPADFPASQLVKPQLVTITAADGLEIHAQLFLPPGGNGGKHPALVFFHGGSRRQMLPGFHYMYYYSNAYALNQYLASQGYVVLSVNYRSGIGYGLNFREALNYGATGASEFNDVLGAGLYLKSRSDVDGSRIGLWGGSYGGYLTALGLARASNLFAAGVDFHGVHDWNLEIENFVPAYDPKGQADAARVAWESSPLASVSTWRSPVLLIHGDDDRNVPFTETVQLVEALRKQHVEFEELIFPNEIHDLLLYRDWVEAYRATAEFFNRRLKNP